jgi:multiple sugar transport system ATP-binding protein
MIYVTHEQVEAMTLGDRLVVLDRGQIQQVGPPDVVFHRPRNRFVAGFLGWPPMNFLSGQLVKEQDGYKFKTGGLDLLVPPETLAGQTFNNTPNVTLGIRPEYVKLSCRGGLAPDLRIEVVSVEPLAETYVIAGHHEGLRISAKVNGCQGFTKEPYIDITLDMKHIYLFEEASGLALGLTDPGG